MNNKVSRLHVLFRRFGFIGAFIVFIIPAVTAQAQPPGPGDGTPRVPFTIEADPRVEQRSYHFNETNEELGYVLYVSSTVSADKPSPLIIALHGLGGDGNFLMRNELVDLAEEQGYIVAAPLGYNVGGWYGSPVVVFGGREVDPPNLTELSEIDVMNVLQMIQEEFNVDANRTYLMGHSMGGAGTLFLGQKYKETWAALAAIAPAAFLMQPNREDILTPIHETGIPVMVVQGDMDTAVPVENTRMWIETMKDMDMKHEYIELKDGDHGTIIWDGMPDIFRFFEANTKTGRP